MSVAFPHLASPHRVRAVEVAQAEPDVLNGARPVRAAAGVEQSSALQVEFGVEVRLAALAVALGFGVERECGEQPLLTPELDPAPP
jgi:hypothetical protein